MDTLTSKKNSKDKKETYPDWNRFCDIHLLPVFIFKLMEKFSSSCPDPRSRHAPCRCGHLRKYQKNTRLSSSIYHFPTLDKSQLLESESFLLIGSNGSVKDLLLLVLFLVSLLNLSSVNFSFSVSFSSFLFPTISVSFIFFITFASSLDLNSLLD